MVLTGNRTSKLNSKQSGSRARRSYSHSVFLL